MSSLYHHSYIEYLIINNQYTFNVPLVNACFLSNSISQQISNDLTQRIFSFNIDDFNSLINNIANNGIEEKIDRDKRLGENMGVTGTPTWMVNGETVETLSESDIRAAIEAALQEAEGNSDESADATNES